MGRRAFKQRHPQTDSFTAPPMTRLAPGWSGSGRHNAGTIGSACVVLLLLTACTSATPSGSGEGGASGRRSDSSLSSIDAPSRLVVVRDQGGGMDAIMAGTLGRLPNGCWTMHSPGDPQPSLVAWPAGTTSATAGEVRLPDGRILRAGQSVRGGGGRVGIAQVRGSASISDPDACLSGESVSSVIVLDEILPS